MKSSKPSAVFNSFEDLKAFMESSAFPLPSLPADRPANPIESKPNPEKDQRLFWDAMADVRPIFGKNRIEKNLGHRPPDTIENTPEVETLLHLKNLITQGEGFTVADTPEYMEGTGYKVSPEIARRLHRGDFSVQTHIDLHGLSADQAQEAFERFLKNAIRTGKRAVLVIHGRGLSSPEKPVLKTKVYEWLTRGPWRKWVIAFSSARPCDGGAGATYVLLRRRPFTKRFRKKHSGRACPLKTG